MYKSLQSLGFPNYEVNEQGVVRSVGRTFGPVIRKTFKSGKLECINLCYQGRKTSISIPKLLRLMFPEGDLD